MFQGLGLGPIFLGGLHSTCYRVSMRKDCWQLLKQGDEYIRIWYTLLSTLAFAKHFPFNYSQTLYYLLSSLCQMLCQAVGA